MEFLFEFILELLLEGSIEASKSRKVPAPIRYLLIIMISLFFIAVIGLIIFAGIISLKKNIIVGILFIILGLYFLIMCIIKFKNTYLNVKKENEHE